MRRLLIRPGAIGDCIVSLPALQALVSDYTEAWVPRAVVPLIQFANRVRPLPDTRIDLFGIGDLPMPEQLRNELRGFDSIVSWYGANRDEFRQALRSAGVDVQFYPALPPSHYGGHATDFFLAQVSAPGGRLPTIVIETQTPRNTIVIHPFSGSKRKNWALERYRELAQQLPLTVEWNVGPEEELAGAVRFPDLKKLAEWIKGARIYIGNDSGITHLAAAIGIKTVAILGPYTPGIWEPRGSNVTVLRANDLDELHVETVVAAINRLLGFEPRAASIGESACEPQ